ncbi:vascular-related unknown protein 1-like [Rutidosis leptorrhynchoides]|uniref:vascular-related unknown protein 1-like n=1 Tax=Rutidosis leptorrhynchoides TaxID=125765 RepID=UPI003A9A5499
MESSSSAMNKNISDCSSREESGWTSYFEDFTQRNLLQEEDHDHENDVSSHSFVSDASNSSVAWKILQHNNHNQLISTPNNLRLLKRNRVNDNDDSLQDTASSPLNSPKVRDLEEVDSSRKKIESHMNIFLGKEFSTNNKSNSEGENTSCTELKRRGLCLVPMSMLENYLR